MNVKKHINYWVTTAEHDLPVAESLFKSGHYDWCLFIGHLVLEKILKAHFVKDNKKEPPKIHDLLILASSTKLTLTKEQEEFLSRATDFNIETRYPRDKFKFYKTATKEFTSANFAKIKEMYQWLKSQLN